MESKKKKILKKNREGNGGFQGLRGGQTGEMLKGTYLQLVNK